MNIIYVDPMAFSGMGLYDFNLLRNLGIDGVTFLGSSKFEHSRELPCPFRGIFRYSEKRGILKGLSYVWSQARVLASIKRGHPDIVHYQWLKVPAIDEFVLKTVSLVSPNTKLVYTAHNLLPHDSGDRFRSVFGRLYNRVDAIVAHTAQTKIELQDQFGIPEDRIHVIPHGLLNLDTAPNQSLVKSLRAQIKPNDEIVFGILGHMRQNKGIDIALSAWRSSPTLRNNPLVRLLIAGRNNHIDFGNDIPNNATIIEGYLSENEFREYLALVDVIVCPYREISQSGVLMTALHERIPVIVSPVGGLRDPFDVSPVGWILEELSADCLRSTLEKIVEDPVKELGPFEERSTWEKIETFYSWRRIGQLTAEMYKRLTED